MTQSVFAKFEPKVWPNRFETTLLVRNIHGGTPDNPKVAEGWIRSKIQDKDALLIEMVAGIMAELGVSWEEAVEKAASGSSVNRFKRDEQGLYIEGRTIKAAIKEAASVATTTGALKKNGYGAKYVKAKGGDSAGRALGPFLAEVVQVDEDRVYLGVEEPDTVVQKFVHTWRGNSISYEEEVTEAKITFTVSSGWHFPEDKEFWPKLWLTGERQGLGASRSQGYGTYSVVGWDKIK